MNIIIEVPGDGCTYKVPVMKVQCYSIEEIFKKKLYFLIPFYIFTYENDFKEYDTNEEKLKELTNIYADLMERLKQVSREGVINEVIKGTITDMSKKVLIHISKQYSNVKEKVGAIMGGQILEYEAKTIYRSGHEAGGDKASKLYELLIQDGRRDEMEKALKDKQLRRKLMQEYGLTEKSTTTI